MEQDERRHSEAFRDDMGPKQDERTHSEAFGGDSGKKQDERRYSEDFCDPPPVGRSGSR